MLIGYCKEFPKRSFLNQIILEYPLPPPPRQYHRKITSFIPQWSRHKRRRFEEKNQSTYADLFL